MDWDNWKTRFEWKARFGQDSIKVFLGAAVISAIGLAGFAMLEPSERGEAPKQPQMFKGVKLSPWIGESELGPRTTFRVVFDKVVASADGVGKSAQLNPLVFEPELDGEFIWDSTRSGIFTPASGIPLDTKYTVTLQPDFAKAHDVLLHINYHTPPMRVQDSQLVSLRRDQSFFAGIAFNVAMDPSRVAPFVEFRAADGKAISAEIEPVTDKHAIWLSGPEPWAVRMLDETKEVAGHPTEIIIRPSQPLTPGMEWQLVLKQGLLSAAGHLLPEDTVCKLGKREPTKMERAVAHNRLNHGRSISIYFNRALAPDLSEQQLAKWLVLEKRIDSAPNKPHRFQRVALEFSTKISGSSLVLKGDFKLGVNYRVRVKRGLPTRLGLALAQNGSEDLVFKPLPGRIYLPGTLMSQAATGNRSFEFISVNNRAIRMRIKRIAPEQLPKVLEVYEQEYLGRDELRWSKRWVWRDGQSLAYSLIPGEEVLDRVIRPRADIDEVVKKEFTWDELLGNDQSGPLFVSIECVGRDGSASSAQLITQLTDVGFIWKKSNDQIFVQAFSLRDAKPLAGATVRMFNQGQQLKATGKTDASGQVTLKKEGRHKGELWLSVSHKGDQHTVKLNAYFAAVPLWAMGVDWGWGNGSDFKTHLFTDRLIYQPGDTVHLKGHVREWGRDGLKLVAGMTLPMEVRDRRRHRIFSQEITVSEQGSFDVSIPLAKGTYGAHTIDVAGDLHFIDVYEYEPATFKVRFPGTRQLAPGAPIEIPLQASYYFGKSLSGAKVKWSFSSSHYAFSPSGWSDFEFGESEGTFSHLSGEGVLDAGGRLTIQPKLPDGSKSLLPMDGDLSVVITDANQQSITAGTSVLRHASDFYLAVRHFERVRWVGQPLPLQVVAVQPDGRPLPEGKLVSAHLRKLEWHSVKMKGAGGAIRYKNERQLKSIGVVEFKTTTREANPQAIGLVPPEAGEYQLELRATDAAGRSVVNLTTFYVSGEQPLAWDYRNEFVMEIKPGKSSYKTGDTANILLMAPFDGLAMVTVERDRVLRSFTTPVTGNAPVIKVPLMETDAPNVFVSVTLLRGTQDSTRKIKAAEYRMGYCELKVERPETRLKVDATISQSNYQPGDEVKAAVKVSDHTGAPAPGVEVTLYAVDEGILDLTGYEAPDLHSFFYKPRTLQVNTFTSFAFMRTEDPNRVAYGNKGHLIGGGGGGGNLRRKFLAVAFWNATLRTDAEGRIRANFTAPDSLTRYRLFAVAHSGNRFGTAETGFRIHQPLMVESALPRFGRVGDQLIAKAMVYNQTDNAIEAEVKLELDASITSKSKTKRRITIPAQGTVAVNFPLQFANVGKARTVWRVRCPAQPKLADARESFIDIRHVAPLRRAIHFSRVRDLETDLLKPIDPVLRQAEGTFTVSVCTSPMAELETASEFLLKYPHGCVEQTSSRLLPWLLLEEFEDVFPQFNPDSPQAGKAIGHGISRLLSMQNHTGGLSYWPGGKATPFASAYGGMALAIAKLHGREVPQLALDRLKKYLTRFVKNPMKENATDEYCLALYTLALLGDAQPASHEFAFEKRADLSASARCLLVMAVAAVDGPDEMLLELLKPAKAPGAAFGYFGNAGSLLGMRLMALCQLDAKNPDAVKLAGTLAARARAGHWGTTFGNAWVVYGMATFSHQHAAKQGPANGTLVWGGQERSYELNANQRRAVFTFANNAGPKEKPILLRNPNERTLFVQVKAAMFPVAGQSKPESRGLSLRRTYTRLNHNGTVDAKAPLRVGDLVRVTLRLEAKKQTHYLAIEDGLPANLEPMNTRLRTQKAMHRSRVPRGWNWHTSHYVLRKDRAVFYVNHLPAGSHQFQYLARVRAAGTANAPAAKAEAMYDPDILGLSASQPIVTIPLNE